MEDGSAPPTAAAAVPDGVAVPGTSGMASDPGAEFPEPVADPSAEGDDSRATPSGLGPEATGAYVVQIGAYRERDVAERAAGELDIDDLVIMPTRRNGKDWFVLLLGAFAGLEEARAAGEAYQASHPGGSYWVRNAEDLRGVRRL